MVNIYYGLNVTHWGLTLLHKMKAIDIGSILNYREVGFGSLIMGHRLAPLMCLGVCSSPILGLGSQWTWSFFSVCWLFGLDSVQWAKATSRIMKVWCRLVSQHCCLFVSYYGYHTSHFHCHVVVTGHRDGKEGPSL